MEILVIEDELDIAIPITQAIEAWGHFPERCSTCKEALQRFKEKKFELVMLDIILPDCMGHELIPHFKALSPETHIITITGFCTQEIENKIKEQNILSHMIKPLDMKTVKEVIDKLDESRSKGLKNGPKGAGKKTETSPTQL